MQPVPNHKSRRADAAAAASASAMTPINKHSTKTNFTNQKRTDRSGNVVPGAARLVRPPQSMAPPPPRDSSGQLAVLQKEGTLDVDEVYGEQEKALSEFMRLHPMLSLESMSHRSLQLMGDLLDDASIPTKELETVSKSHDDIFLSPPDVNMGERACCLGERCICVWMARWRYGEETDMAFVGKEFLLPSQHEAYLANGTLPATPGKCLVCSRYYTTFLYRTARSDPTFKPSDKIPLQAYSNTLGVASGESVPTHASVACDSDGYRQEALLFVDEEWTNTSAARGGMSTFLWRPCVKFCANHYTYVRDPISNLPRIVQRNVGSHCPREVILPEVAPLHSTFESAGVLGALRRLYSRLRVDYAHTIDTTIGTLPTWVQTSVFQDAVSRCDCTFRGPVATRDAMGLVRAQRRLRQLIDAEMEPSDDDDQLSDADLGPEPVQPVVEPVMDPHRVAAIVRLCHGELLEAYARRQALRLCPVDDMLSGPGPAAELAQLCNDAGLVASWTSAHAEYLASIDDLMSGFPGPKPPTVVELMVPEPELYTVPCSANNADLVALYERISSPKACPKTAQCMLALLSRVTNAGSRGWESTLETVAKESEGGLRVCMHAIGVALSGMNVCIHPAVRRHWHTRLAIVRHWRNCNSTADFRELTTKCPIAIKEVIRMHLASMLAEDVATLEALATTNLPAGQLSIPPRSMPPSCLQAAMHALAAAGEELVRSNDDMTPAAAVNMFLTSESRARKKQVGRASGLLTMTPKMTMPLVYCCSWLGGRCGPSAASLCSATTVVSNLLGASFRADYVPFWLHSHQNGLRASRLDVAQYQAVHTQSAAHKMCSLLDEATALRVQRLALTVNDASLLTVTQTIALLGLSRPGEIHDYDEEPAPPPDQERVATSSGSSRVIQEAENIIMSLDARSAAILMLFARCCALRSQMLSYDLGPRTRQAQARAVCRRLLVMPVDGETYEETALRRLPAHCTHLFCCSECRRIVNARQDGSGKEAPFNEVGLSASMLHVDGAVCDGHMRCAKRSSAALRTAVALEEAADTAEVESRPVGGAATKVPGDLRPSSVMSVLNSHVRDGRETASEIAKLRRDIKNCFEQHPKAVACGGVPLVRVPILGRAIRLFDDWYALCAFCGCLAQISPSSRFRGDPCCMRCDFAMLHGKEAAKEMQARLPKPPAPACRYCGRTQPENGSARWKMVAAPADTGGRNATVPPPLRTVHYCPLHWRSWLTNAHKEMPTNIIFAHILQRARPMFGADKQTNAAAQSHGRSADNETHDASVAAKTGRKRCNNRSAIARRLGTGPRSKRQKKSGHE